MVVLLAGVGLAMVIIGAAVEMASAGGRSEFYACVGLILIGLAFAFRESSKAIPDEGSETPTPSQPQSEPTPNPEE